jgi:phenylacetate-CoA ligase
MRALRPNVWVTTPTGALDFLARLYLEFNVDPMELDLERIVLVGEVGSPGTERRLADEFEARVTGVYCDPVFGVALAHGLADAWQVTDPEVLGLGMLERDEGVDWRSPSSEGRCAELVLRATWSPPLAERTLRTGQVVGAGKTTCLFGHTVGDHVLVRGRWLSIPLLRRALAGIDGIAGWRLAVARGDGTLDKLTVSLAFERPSLVENPMWAGRAREAIASITPIAFELETEVAEGEVPAETIEDHRGHHLGLDRLEAARRAGR